MADNELSRLRAEAVRAHKAANRKASRLRSQGVEIAGTYADPRRNLSNVRTYTKAQARNYIEKLQTFNDRSTQYVPGARGVPLPKAEYQELVKQQTFYQWKAQREYEPVKNITLPGGHTTIQDRVEDILPRRRMRSGATAARPFDINAGVMPSTDIVSPDALRQLNRSMAGMHRGGRFGRRLKQQRKEAMDMMIEIGDLSLMERVSALTDDQFDTFWNWAAGASELSREYAIARAKGKKVFDARVHESNLAAVSEYVSWAETLPSTVKRNRT